jgi:hypothetical protein
MQLYCHDNDSDNEHDAPDDFSLASRGKTAVLTLTSAPPSPAKMAAPANTMSTRTGNSTVFCTQGRLFLCSGDSVLKSTEYNLG